MAKTIWYISKYCNLPTENSVGSRGWILMREFAAKGYNSKVITSDVKSINLINKNLKFKNFFLEGVEVIILKTLKFSVAKSILRVFSWFDFEFNLFFLDKSSLKKPDVIIISSLSLLTILNGINLKNKFKCKLVFEIRDIWPLTLVEEGGFSKRNPFIMLLALIERIGYKRSDLIVGTMPNLAEHVKKILGYDKFVGCIPMGVEPNMLTHTKDNIPEYLKLHIKPGYFNVVFAGSIGITNALDTFFKAAEVLKNNSKIRFIVVGDGDLKNQYLKRYGHLENLTYFPKVAKNQVQSFLTYADVLYFSVFKSKVWDYGQSLNKIIDYMISKKPIIASFSGYKSMIDEAGCGYFIPAEDHHSLVDKIKEMSLMDETERKIMGERGLKWLLKNRSYQKLAENYLNLIFDNKS